MREAASASSPPANAVAAHPATTTAPTRNSRIPPLSAHHRVRFTANLRPWPGVYVEQMAQRTVWLRRDPVGSQSRLPSRDEFRGRHARRALTLGPLAIGALALLVLLRALPRLEGAWKPLLGIVFWFGIAGVGAAAVALRTPRLRPRALAGLGLSSAALIGAVFVDRLVDLAGG